MGRYCISISDIGIARSKSNVSGRVTVVVGNIGIECIVVRAFKFICLRNKLSSDISPVVTSSLATTQTRVDKFRSNMPTLAGC